MPAPAHVSPGCWAAWGLIRRPSILCCADGSWRELGGARRSLDRERDGRAACSLWVLLAPQAQAPSPAVLWGSSMLPCCSMLAAPPHALPPLQVQKDFPTMNRTHLRDACAGSSYALTLLLQGYKFNDTTWLNIHFVRQVGRCPAAPSFHALCREMARTHPAAAPALPGRGSRG